MLIDYSVTKTFEQTLDIVDPGRTAIRAVAQDGATEYYVVTKTVDGVVTMIRFGPIFPDMPNTIMSGSAENNFELYFDQFYYDESAIKKAISKYVNAPMREISLLEEIDDYDALSKIPNMLDTYNNL